jgi:hypothetical protein
VLVDRALTLAAAGLVLAAVVVGALAASSPEEAVAIALGDVG